MKKLLTLALLGTAGILWTNGLGLAFRSETGLLVLALVAGLFAMRFGASLVQGRFREEFRRAVPNSWVRRYIVVATFFLFTVPGFMNFFGPWIGVDRLSGRIIYGQASPDWSLAILFALVMPAIILVGWAQASHPTADPHPNPS